MLRTRDERSCVSQDSPLLLLDPPRTYDSFMLAPLFVKDNLMRILLVIPAHNEELFLGRTIHKIVEYIVSQNSFGDTFDILIVDNGSTDTTERIGLTLAQQYEHVNFKRIEAAGKGLAIRSGWMYGDYDYYCYIDADLAHEPASISLMISALQGGHDVVVCSRTHRDSNIVRPWLRKFLTRGYNILLRLVFQVRFTDAQAGCKGISQKARQILLAMPPENGYFFDTRLLISAEKSGYEICDLPCVYIDPRSQRFGLVRVILYFLRKVFVFRIELWKS